MTSKIAKTFEQGKDEVARLCRFFITNREQLHAPETKEAHIRQMLIDPFWSALGWDVQNLALVAPQYREVIPEDSLDVEGQQKAPDYAFRIGTLIKFYVEAKKCRVNIHKDLESVYQLRRYGWSGKIATSILTNFKELSVYDCTQRPYPHDKASRGRVLYFTFNEYPDRWDELWDIFSCEAVWSGAFDNYSAAKRKQGTSEVDSEFLKEIEGWRDKLARNVALRNRGISSDDLNSAVQRTIDRIVFLRIAEDRGLEPRERLLKLCGQANIYFRFMRDSCGMADKKYNSGLFHFQNEPGTSEAPDRITPNLVVDDKIFKPILQSLYFEYGSPYHFGVLPVEILGTIYERFLGKVIRLTAGHKAKIEYKPEVRKTGGVYYTPAYIVDYIVKQTVGKQIEGKSPNQLAGDKEREPLRILDMACGSGSFLLGAYQHLLDFYLKWYVNHKSSTPKRIMYKNPRNDQWQLTVEEKKRILTTHIFGVDIDPQAVEVSKLSLLLKALEGENDTTLSMQLKLFEGRPLPNLANNIKCGNSLISSDYFMGGLVLNPDEIKRVNPFDWKDEFPNAIASGGFDCVIGNPPYVFTRDVMTAIDRKFYSENYTLGWEKRNTYMLFMEKLLNLVKPEGLGSFIVPNSWLTMESAKLLRQQYLRRLNQVIDLNFTVFSGVSMEPCIFVISGSNISRPVGLSRINTAEQIRKITYNPVVRTRLQEYNKIVFHQSSQVSDIIERLYRTTKPLSTLFDVRTGLQAYEEGKGNPPQTTQDVKNHVFDRTFQQDERCIRYLLGKDVKRYSMSWSGLWMRYGPWLSQPRRIDIFTRPRILLREITGSIPYCLNFTYVEEQFLNNKSILNILDHQNDRGRLKTLLGILNSRLLSFYYKQQAVKSGRKIFPKVVIKDLGNFPIPNNLPQQKDILILVEQTLILHEHLLITESERQIGFIHRQIGAIDRKVDQLVYDLYGLTPAEIAIVEDR